MTYTKPQRTPDTCHFEGVSETIVDMVVFGERVDLRLFGEPPKGIGEDEAIVINEEGRPELIIGALGALP